MRFEKMIGEHEQKGDIAVAADGDEGSFCVDLAILDDRRAADSGALFLKKGKGFHHGVGGD